MADTDPPAGTPDPVVTDEGILLDLHRYLTVVARFTMHPVHHYEYNKIVSSFDAQNIPYEEFRFQMVWLLQRKSNYAHMRVYWDVVDRVITGEENMLNDNPLFLYPVVLYFLTNLFLNSAQIRDPLWNVQQESILASQRELSRIRSRRYRRAGRDLMRALEPNFNPESNLFVLLDWFQEMGARIIMGREDYDCYAKLQYDHCHGLMPHDKFMEEMGALLQSPDYQFLRLWWHIHRMDVCGVRRIVDNPFLRFPLALCVTWTIVFYFAMFADTLWNLFLNTVRRHRRRRAVGHTQFESLVIELDSGMPVLSNSL